MRSTGFAAAAVGSAVALVGFAGAANASATIDLIWAASGTDQITLANTSSAITLQVILTAGPNGSVGAGVSVDYSGVLPKLTVLGFASTPSEGADSPLPLVVGTTTDTGSRIENINSASFPFFIGTGLSAGQSHQLGTVTFHKSLFLNGVFEIRSDANGPTDEVLNLFGDVITGTSTFNSAFMINLHGDPPPCDFVIEINALRGGSPTVTVGSPKKITAKARIQKGTATTDTTIDTTLRIDAIDGFEVIDQQISDPIRLGVGKGGQGDTLTMNIPQCLSGFIHFDATFFGLDDDGDQCQATRRITKTCK